MRFQGIIPPHVTPFDEEGGVDLSSLDKLLDFWLNSRVHGLATCASNGEGPLLDEEERKIVIKSVVDKVGGEIPVIAGVSSPSTKRVIRQIEQAEKLEVDGILLTPPYYFKPSTRELLEHYRTVLRSSSLPILLYNVPKFVGYDIPIELIGKIAEEHGNFSGIKESSGAVWRISELIRILGRRWSVLAGTGDVLLPTLALGGDGGIVAVSIFAPELTVKLYDLFKAGDLKGAADIQRVLTMLNEVVVKRYNQLSATKEALRLRGLPGGFARMPSQPLSEEERNDVKKALELANLI
ncbi:MAG: dihydrodipicolinate synthase family protein [Candidatus Methanodesulfokora washburnensis]|jgi:4-hydroxy-tetrahydrodipicolinate synthase|uniref:Dihydrodipicolinate synthase family protein n=1 Tax=Candidatus Methanodesulfokora washburnensis TaxID=2478471 RepID=A0A3R9PE73_9CREN|nr:dihydrodipicolinate synthase family protein [Candidatus Methanodesulfokores washburnensis]RSN73984.1 dihydrodipicolinate synthase family protein [Candidatus Methanodesulfokores washburnensis]